ncbi:DNA-binding protein [Kerstersia gyiorum]|nr:DNA-binding protein [Kerstersia gyiorum]
MHGLRRPLRILVGLPQLAELLHHSPDGLRVALRTSQPYALQIRQARVNIGRRVYFRTADIASYLSQAAA